jgi:hypothetical protein
MAETSVYLDSAAASAATPAIVEADIELNAVDYQWTVDAKGERSPRARDLVTALVHELGHALGLEHNCDDIAGFEVKGSSLPACRHAGAELRAATMFPAWLEGQHERHRLGPDERLAISQIYPVLPSPISSQPARVHAAVPPVLPGSQPSGLPRWIRWLGCVVPLIFLTWRGLLARPKASVEEAS